METQIQNPPFIPGSVKLPQGFLSYDLNALTLLLHSALRLPAPLCPLPSLLLKSPGHQP